MYWISVSVTFYEKRRVVIATGLVKAICLSKRGRQRVTRYSYLTCVDAEVQTKEGERLCFVCKTRPVCMDGWMDRP